MCIKKNEAPRTELWGTPKVMEDQHELFRLKQLVVDDWIENPLLL